MTAGSRDASHRWVELAAGAVLLMAALEELAYVRQRLARAGRTWWQDLEHRDHSGMERSTLNALGPWIMARRFRH